MSDGSAASRRPNRDSRAIIIGGSVLIGLLLITVMHFTLPEDAAALLIDRGGSSYPLSVQNMMWLTFFFGLGELFVRHQAGTVETMQLRYAYLPEREGTVLQLEDVGKIYSHVKASPFAQQCFLPRMILRAILQFQSTRTIEQASSVLTNSLELYLHEIDLRYNMIRYVMWLIPTLGFIGTVIGIALALSYAGQPGGFENPNLLPEVTQRLAVAFNTTLVALVMAAVLVFGSNIIQSKEERALNLAGQYCFDNLINRLYVVS
ncbi:MAG: MotA/TolQ/ExbB proton channel family protein [Candidatus Thiodiazotropha taylori]